MSFNPWRGERRPCWHCTSFDGMTAGESAALCARPEAARVRAMPGDGCCSWEREVGADDVPEWSPVTGLSSHKAGQMGDRRRTPVQPKVLGLN
jgi:hypothetical protein